MTGAELITQERQRQIEKEGWTPEHDDEHEYGQLAEAAVCYAAPHRIYYKDERQDATIYTDPWPWDNTWDKRERGEKTLKIIPNHALPLKKRIRNLVKAGALIAAEIDRLQRLQAKG